MLIISLAVIVSITVIMVVFCSRNLLHRGGAEESDADFISRRKHFIFSIIYFIFLVTGTLVIMNFAASFYAVPWPMNGLHGVTSEVGKDAWLYREKVDGFVKPNSWGQRDREHTVKPAPDAYRMIFIGDSFLEDGPPVPLPYRTEEILKRMGHTSYDIINLGVSATDPDEYFFRLKKIGLPLRPKHCVMFFSVSSDFIQEPSLLSYAGISATYPRSSFLQFIGLRSLDHVISNERRPILLAWFKGGSLLKHLLGLREKFGKTANDLETENTYLSFYPPEQQSQLKSVLYKSSGEERSLFYSMLRKPDELFLYDYYLFLATNHALGLLPKPEFVSEKYSYKWIKAASGLCRSKGIKFTLVVAPDGFAVDSRMQSQYAAVADMKAYLKYKDEAADRLSSYAAKDGMDVVDLRDLLKDYPGAYLNMDGHWSRHGVEIVAQHLAKKFSQKND
jgi:hypothetical protein